MQLEYLKNNKLKKLFILALLLVTLPSYGQRFDKGDLSSAVEDAYGKPDTIMVWAIIEDSNVYAWFYSSDTIIEIFQDTVFDAMYNATISYWYTGSTSTRSGQRIYSYPKAFEIEIIAKDNYNAGEPIIVDLVVKNISDTARPFLNNEEYYYVDDGEGSYFSASIRDSFDLVCKFPYEWNPLKRYANDSDYIYLKPKQEIRKKLNVTKIVYDCICEAENGLKAGVYYLHIDYYWRYRSNRVKIVVE